MYVVFCWPVALELLGHEAWRRYELGELTEKEFYCVAAQRKGLESSLVHA